MAQIAVGDAITAGFGVIRRRPVAVLLWGLVQLAMAALIGALMAPFYIALFGQVAASVQAEAAPDPAALQAAGMQMQGVSFLLNLVAAAVSAVIYCAVFRSILHPDRSRWGYLRVGAAELYTLVLMIGGYFAFVIALVVVTIPIAIIVGVMIALKAVAAGVALAVIAGAAVLIAVFYLALRFSMVVPMMVDDGQFRLTESWKLTRGHALQLFLVALGAVALLMLLEILVVIVLFGVGMASLSLAAGGLDHVEAFFKQPPGAILARLAPFLVVLAVVWAPIAGAAMALWGAPWARAYRDLVQPDVSTTFA